MCHILHEDLRFHYIVNHLCDTDKPARLAFCREFSEMLNADPDILNKLIMSDETPSTYLSSLINRISGTGVKINPCKCTNNHYIARRQQCDVAFLPVELSVYTSLKNVTAL
ncbi:hypothetical protein ANN_22046 [Periplaneta americana]|uniref:Uncharacterized protein n=1 Tax=Periplaneta americana TaxID=6978 RepID=A0ABQ8S7F4_PERAM|nr:hypothetical protein ANN_22046 [Periplaneta americana]